MNKSIRIIITGGTIDDLEYDSIDNAPKEHKSFIPDLLKQSRITSDYQVEEFLQKDSRFITDKDRGGLVKKCKECKEKMILITHGTATMSDTARYLGKENLEKTIILFGSAIPANKKNSDALFNLGTAFSAVQLLPKGVYVVMNGSMFTWDNVKKNFDKGVFETSR